MKDLNSVLLEGVIKQVTREEDQTRAVVEHTRFSKDDKETARVPIEVISKLKDSPCLVDGRKVRVVAMIKEKDGQVYLRCEHIEFQPEINGVVQA